MEMQLYITISFQV